MLYTIATLGLEGILVPARLTSTLWHPVSHPMFGYVGDLNLGQSLSVSQKARLEDNLCMCNVATREIFQGSVQGFRALGLGFIFPNRSKGRNCEILAFRVVVLQVIVFGEYLSALEQAACVQVLHKAQALHSRYSERQARP